MSFPPGLNKPGTDVRLLEGRARMLSNQLSQRVVASSRPHGKALIDLGISAFVPHGLKGASRRFASGYGGMGRVQQSLQDHQAVDALIHEARTFFGQVSMVAPSLGPGGNSNQLLRRLGAALDTGSPASRAAKLTRALGGLANTDLLFNNEVPRYLEWREISRQRRGVERSSPELASILRGLPELVDLTHLERQLTTLTTATTVIEPLLGAIQRLKEGGNDAYRQGLNSLRVALDALIEEIGGKGDWKEAGRKLVSNLDEWAIVVKYHHLLSRGSHPGSDHDSAELILALQLFGAIAPRLAQRRGLEGADGTTVKQPSEIGS